MGSATLGGIIHAAERGVNYRDTRIMAVPSRLLLSKMEITATGA